MGAEPDARFFEGLKGSGSRYNTDPGLQLLRAWVVLFVAFLGLTGAWPVSGKTDCCETRYISLTRGDTERFPSLLGVSEPVSLVSWVEMEGTGAGRSLHGSLVLPEPTLNRIQDRLPDSLDFVARHEYVMPRPTRWHSLHFQQSDVTDTLVRSVKQIFGSFREREPGISGDRSASWSRLKEQFPRRGQRMGDVFIVTNRVDVAQRKRTNTNVPKDYVTIQPVAGEWVVLGDIIATARRVGPIIRYLYRQDFHFLSLAYNTLHLGRDERELYFVHVAGSGSPDEISPVVRTLFDSTAEELIQTESRTVEGNH